MGTNTSIRMLSSHHLCIRTKANHSNYSFSDSTIREKIAKKGAKACAELTTTDLLQLTAAACVSPWAEACVCIGPSIETCSIVLTGNRKSTHVKVILTCSSPKRLGAHTDKIQETDSYTSTAIPTGSAVAYVQLCQQRIINQC